MRTIILTCLNSWIVLIMLTLDNALYQLIAALPELYFRKAHRETIAQVISRLKKVKYPCWNCVHIQHTELTGVFFINSKQIQSAVSRIPNICVRIGTIIFAEHSSAAGVISSAQEITWAMPAIPLPCCWGESELT